MLRFLTICSDERHLLSLIMDHLQLIDHVVQKSPNWRANDALGYVKERKFKYGAFV